MEAIEDYAQELAKVVRCLLEVDGWQRTERIAAGGGFREGRVGELAIGRASVLLKSLGLTADLMPIHNHPEAAGLIGGLELFPRELISGYGSLLALDIGGTNFRGGLVSIAADAESHRSGRVVARESWRHADEQPTRDAAVRKLVGMLGTLLQRALRQDLKLAPYVAIACPGRIASDGRIESGGQNLPGNWEAEDFNLPQIVGALLLQEFNWHAQVLMHNDAVVQGLSEVPFMLDVEHWGILAIGTGLGHAHFTNRK